MTEIYVSTDVETDGPIPGPHSILSFASAAFRTDGSLVDTFSRNPELLPGAEGHPATMEWWRKNPQAWEACRVNPVDPARASKDKEYSFVDCVSFVVMEKLGIHEAWTTDSDFSHRFTASPGPCPK